METDRLKFGRTLEVCLGHADALQDALNDLGGKHFSAADLLALSSSNGGCWIKLPTGSHGCRTI